MNTLPQSQFDALFLENRPLMDVRAPVEFAKGAFPCAHNRPLMNDREREQVGTCYKQQGQQAAIELGHELVGGQVKEERVQSWLDFARAHPDAVLYCFRGGMRSQIVQRWLAEAGVEMPYVQGGYKALRSHLIEVNDRAARRPIHVVAGTTGSGKTEFIQQFAEAVDLEGLAEHRGSAFGRRLRAQPSPIDFENRLAVALLEQQRAGIAPLLLEDESRLIGSVALPLSLFEAMREAPLFVLEEEFEARVARIEKDYILDNLAESQASLGEEAGFEHFAETLRASMGRIRKRLGDQRFQQLNGLLEEALAAQQGGDRDGHREWIRILLRDYYDPMYHYQLDKKAHLIRARGDHHGLAQQIRAQLG
ncbi:tRNA 2-selenouridine(34) synthase MnmH [Gallaecimonas sp. GXIMD4217]|uniref:tRNA 2-selenouridine(34) synthase MnmH n=1 Tax=Gallaecimonas sp. GXIMD4217 TaxID=3131927 RepID=UPI00311B3209